MAAPDLQPSRGLQRAVSTERDRIRRARERAIQRRAALVEELRLLDAEIVALAERGALLDQLVADSPEAAPEGVVLHGRRIAEVATRLLLEHRVETPIHYRDWYALLEGAGYVIAAKDPLASFLTNVSRSVLVRRAGRAGHYELDREAPERIEQRRAEVRAELVDVRGVRDRRGDDEGLEEHETRLSAELSDLERQLHDVGRLFDGRAMPRAA